MEERMAFIVAGVQKSGTTALFNYLKQQDALQAPAHKELHFFDDETRNWADPDYGPLHAAFPPAGGRLRFEATPVTFYWPNALERAKNYNPALKLMLIFRDPVARAYSHWRMERARGSEQDDFGWCIREGRRRFANPHRVFSYVERGFYGRQLARARSIFGVESLLCLSSAALARSPNAVLVEVFQFLNIGHPPEPVVAKITRPEVAEMDVPATPCREDIDYLRDLYSDDMAAFIAMSGLDPLDLVEPGYRS